MKAALIDLSAIFRRHWHASEQEDTGHARRRTLTDVTRYAAECDGAAVCIDSPPYKRKEISPEYKAHRDKTPAVLVEELRKTIETLANDGFVICGAAGYEADDIIARAVAVLTADGHECVIYSADKDLMQLLDPSVEMFSPRTEMHYSEATVVERYGVRVEQLGDLLAIMGDKSDGIAGVPGVGPKTAAKWLQDYGDIYGVIEAAREKKLGAKGDAIDGAALLRDRSLVELDTSAEIDLSRVFDLRRKKETSTMGQEEAQPETVETEPEVITPKPVAIASQPPTPVTAIARREWTQELEPSDSAGAWKLANILFESRAFGVSNPGTALSMILAGRSRGVDAVTSLMNFHAIKGRVCSSAQFMQAQVMRSSVCEYFQLIESTAEVATYETKRRGAPAPTRLSFTIEQAKRAGLDGGDNYRKRPETMLRWRCVSELCRIVYPEIVAGLYSVEEMEAA